MTAAGLGTKAARVISEELKALAKERSWPDDLLRRIAEARVPPSALHGWAWWVDAEGAERQLSFHERLVAGDLRGREATLADADGLSDLWANAPERIGDFEITILREPNAFAQFRLQENVTLSVLEQDAQLVACVSWSRRNVIVGGRRIAVTYGQALRVRDSHRRMGLGDQVRRLSIGANVSRPITTQYDIMRSQNFAVVNWWQKYNPEFFDTTPKQEGEVPGIPIQVWQVPTRAGGEDAAIRPTRPEDLPRCVELINRTHEGQDLFRPYTVEFLEGVLDEGFWGERPEWWRPVYDWTDHHVLEENGRIVACAGLWDRGAHVRERWRHRESGEEKTLAEGALLDWGYQAGAEEAMERLLLRLNGISHERGRDMLLVPIDHQPALAATLEKLEPVPEERWLRWSIDDPRCERLYTDLRYW